MRIRDFDFKKTLKGSNVYRNSIRCVHSTPSGSHNSFVAFFYKHQIPSGLFLNNMEAYIQKGLKELKSLPQRTQSKTQRTQSMMENELSNKIIGAALKVHSALGPGLLGVPIKNVCFTFWLKMV